MMNRFTRTVAVLFLVYAAISGTVIASQLQMPADQVFVSDAGDYHNGAVNLVMKGKYSVDGEHAFVEREPGQSMYLAVIYRIFGVGNRPVVYIFQMLAYFGASLLFVHRLRRFISDRAVLLTLGFLLFLPSIYHVVYSFNREFLTLALFMIVAQAVVGLMQRPRWIDALVAGAAFGFLLITYSPFIYLPVALLPLLLVVRIPWKHVVCITLLTIIPVLFWALRNQRVTHEFCLTRCNSTVQIWHVRGIQAEELHGIEPIMCLWAEYVSRDWSNRSFACSFNHVKNMQWPNGVRGPSDEMKAIGEAGMAKIKAHFLNYLWFSVIDIIELYLPYLGWGRMYNVLASIGQLILYIGCLAGIVGFIRRKIAWNTWYLIPLLIMAYTTAVFIVTDATPRYLMPIIFCYCLLAGIGFDWFLKRGSTPYTAR